MHRNSVEAFLEISRTGEFGFPKEVELNRGLMGNGLKYCSVQLTCDDGVQYYIKAFGDEAEELYIEATKEKDRLLSKHAAEIKAGAKIICDDVSNDEASERPVVCYD